MELIASFKSFRDNKISFLRQSKIFNELFCLFSCAIIVLAWIYNSHVGYIFFTVLGSLSLLFLDDIKYFVISAFGLLFSNSEGFNATSLPIVFMVCAIVLFVILFIYIGFNYKQFNLKYIKPSLPLLGLAILGIIPLFWNTSQIPEGEISFYFIYFNNLLYFVLLFVLSIFFKGDSFSFLTTFFFYLLFVIVIQLIFGNIRYFSANPEAQFLDAWFYIGWGLCNEAGIMICFILPFLFIKIKHTSNVFLKCLFSLSIPVAIAGAILSGSRGTYLFFTFELILMFAYFIYKTRSYKLCLAILIIFIAGFIALTCTYGMDKFVDFVYNVLMRGNDDSSRFKIWGKALEIFVKNPVSLFFGSGFCCYFYETSVFGQVQLVMMVFHSTLFETLAVYGFLGLIFLIVHLCQKYLLLKKFRKEDFFYLLIGFIGVDLYGLIDNTYYMWYYMVPLMIVMASIIKYNNKADNEKEILTIEM